MERKIYEKLALWKQQSNGRSALLIDGARRIGKTYIVEEFAKNEYKTFIKIDFSMINKNVLDIFENRENSLDDFFNKLQVFMGTKLYKRESLIMGTSNNIVALRCKATKIKETTIQGTFIIDLLEVPLY